MITVRYRSTFRLFTLLVVALTVKVTQVSLLPPAAITDASLRAGLVVVGPGLLITAVWAALYVFTYRQDWTYNGVQIRTLRGRSLIDRPEVSAVQMNARSLHLAGHTYEFDTFLVEGKDTAVILDPALTPLRDAKKVLNQWVALRPELLQQQDLMTFLAHRPGWRERPHGDEAPRTR